MRNSIFNNQNKSKNINDALPLTGLYSIISKNSNINIITNTLHRGMLLDNTKCIIDTLSSISKYSTSKVLAVNNSFVSEIKQNLDTSINKVNNLNNSSYNFKYYSKNVLTSAQLELLEYVTINDTEKTLSSCLWNNELINDGNCFYWKYFNNINNKIICQNIYNYNINIKGSITFLKLNNILNYIPKNLNNITLNININDFSKLTIENEIDYLKINDFYNGKIYLTIPTYSTDITKGKISIKNIENIQIDKCKLKGKLDNIIQLDNVKNCYIHDCIFENTNTQTLTGCGQNYKAKLAIKLNVKVFPIIYIKNSKCILKDNSVSGIMYTFIYGDYNTIIHSYDNELTCYTFTETKYRPIIYYLNRNSFCTAYDKSISKNDIKYDIAKITFNNTEKNYKTNYIDFINDINIQIQQLANNLNIEIFENIKYTFNYGYAVPGSIFNHYHKKYILNKEQLYFKNNQQLLLPLGTLFYTPKVIFNTNTKYDENNIGLITVDNNTVNVGLTYQDGAFNFIQYNNEQKIYSKYDNLLNKLNDSTNYNVLPIPLTSLTTRIKSSWAENCKYARIFNNIFELSGNRYFISGALSKDYLSTNICLSTSNPVKNKEYNNISDTNVFTYVVQYSQRIDYNKNIYVTNLQENI